MNKREIIWKILKNSDEELLKDWAEDYLDTCEITNLEEQLKNMQEVEK